MKTINKIFITLFIITSLFIVGENNYFYDALYFLVILAVSYFLIFAIHCIKEFPE